MYPLRSFSSCQRFVNLISFFFFWEVEEGLEQRKQILEVWCFKNRKSMAVQSFVFLYIFTVLAPNYIPVVLGTLILCVSCSTFC